MVSKQSRKIPNRTATGRNGVQGFWIKKLASLHERTGFQLNKILNGKEQLPECLTYVQPAFGQKGQTKGNTQDNYRPISCLLLMWRLLTGIISKYLYSFLEEENTLPEEQKVVEGIAEELKIRYYWMKQCLESTKGEVQTLQ